MYKVVIIDDEEIISEGLKHCFPWDQFNCEVVATATDARLGSIAVQKYRPHILFTDIKMPNMDGLTMLEGLKGEFPDMQISILTGFRDFEFARRAIAVGVTRFLLKPSKMNELAEAINAMTANLRKGNSTPEDNSSENLYSQDLSFIVKNALKYIETHYTDKLSLTDIAENIFVSPWYLSKLLNKHTGKSFTDILHQVRISKAKQLLVNTDYRIGKISELCGFNDVTNFSKTFKKLENSSPNEYRQKFG